MIWGEAEHRRHEGWERGHIRQIGTRTTREEALMWEEEQRNQGKPDGTVAVGARESLR